MTRASQFVVRHDEARSRYEACAGDAVASFVEYRDCGDVVDLFHTETAHRFAGRGAARTVVTFALADLAKRQPKPIVATCWFVAQILDESTPETSAADEHR